MHKMEDINEKQRRLEQLKKYQENPQAFIDFFRNPNNVVGKSLTVPLPKEKGFLVKTKFGYGRTKHSDKIIQGKLPVYLDNGQRVLLNPNNIKLTGFID